LQPIGEEALTMRSIGRMVQSRVAAACCITLDFGRHSLKRGALTTGMQSSVHPILFKHLSGPSGTKVSTRSSII